MIKNHFNDLLQNLTRYTNHFHVLNIDFKYFQYKMSFFALTHFYEGKKPINDLHIGDLDFHDSLLWLVLSWLKALRLFSSVVVISQNFPAMSYKIWRGFVLKAILTFPLATVCSTLLPGLFLSSLVLRESPVLKGHSGGFSFGLVHFNLLWLLTPIHQCIISHSKYVV